MDYYILCVLGDGCLQRDICNLALTSKQTINSALKKMEKQGLLRLCLFHGAEQRHGFRCDFLCTDAGLSDRLRAGSADVPGVERHLDLDSRGGISGDSGDCIAADRQPQEIQLLLISESASLPAQGRMHFF